MVKLHKSLLVFLVLLLAESMVVIHVEAQDDVIEAEIFPSKGTASTEILIRFNTRNATIGSVETADFFWDDSTIELNKPGVRGADGSYNYQLKVPTESPYSDVGNHTIRVYSFVSNYGSASFNFTFEITEYVPSLEYVALNATYYALLANYTDLLGNCSSLTADYSSLLVNYTTLLADHDALLNEHNSLLSDYNSLSANYNSLIANYNALSANYNSMLTNYNNLHSLYSLFLANYTSLQGYFNSLSSNYDTLRTDYDSLESNYHGLKTNYDALLGELSTTRNVTYVFIASTIILAATTVYLFQRKPKLTSKTR